tara:strand:- start:122973 stop:125309 length:2337 start_codon:yes stop_codon:yes gene_type:complete
VKRLVLLAILFSYQFGSAQKVVEDIAQSYFDFYKYPVENFVCQFNKSSYFSGEEAYFQLFVVDNREKKLFTETKKVCFRLYNQNGTLLTKKYLEVRNGVAHNSITIPKDYQSSVLYYTVQSEWSLNFDKPVPKPIFVNVEKDDGHYLQGELDAVTVVPEGNAFVVGLTNLFFVKATDRYENGKRIEGVIKDNLGNELTYFKTDSLGFGRFFLKPKKDRRYEAEIISGAFKSEIPLPLVEENGIVFNVFDKGEDFYFGFRANLKSTDSLSYLIHSDGKIALAGILTLDEDQKNAFYFKKNKLLPGVNTISVFQGKQLIGERSFYNKFDRRNTNVVITKKRINKDSVQFEIQKQLTDSIAYLSVSVLPTANTSTPNEALFEDSYLHKVSPLLSKRQRGNLSNFTLRRLLEMNPLSHRWNKILRHDTVAIRHYLEQGFDIKGFLFDKKKGDTLKNTSITFFTANQAGSIMTDAKGQFELNQLVYEKGEVLKMDPQVPRKVKPKYQLIVSNDPFDTIIEVDLKKTIGRHQIVANSLKPFFDEDYEELSGIELKALKRTKVDPDINPLDNTSFTQNFEVDSENVYNYRTVLQYLEMMSSIVVDNRESFVSIYNTRTNSQTIIGNNGGVQPMNIYIDQILMRQQDAEMLKNIYMHEVKSIRINKSGIGGGGLNPYGSIHIYMNKKGIFKEVKKRKKKDSGVLYIELPDGFSKPAKYETPEYLFEPGTKEFNRYATLHWEPNITLAKDKQSFYAAIPDKIKSYQVIVRGITSTGKLINLSVVLSD